MDNAMGYGLAAGLILVLHLLFIAFVIFGGVLSFHRTFWAWLHLPAVIWAVWVELSGSTCPLTPLENHFRKLAFGQGYQEGFIEHYLVPLIYPEQLTISLRLILGGFILAANVFVYCCVVRKRRKQQGQVDG
ncbi:MAG: DUF2784 domain-containing protein [Desulfuromonadales bacterium]